MNKIVITTDSGMCPIKKKDSIVIPAQIVNNMGISCPDDGKLTNKEILENMKKNITYKTSSPLLGDYENTFSEILKDGKDVIHISMGSGISESSVNSANLIAKDLNKKYDNKVYVIDSLTGAIGGTLFYELAYNEIINSSNNIQEIIENLNALKNDIKTSFYVPNIEGFVRSGRDKTKKHFKDTLLTASATLAKRAMFKFRVDFHENGDLYLKKIFRCPEIKGMKIMVENIVNKETIENYDSKIVAIGSLYKDKVNLEEIKDYLNSFNYFDKIIEKEIGSVVAAYGCNDLCGISLVKKRTITSTTLVFLFRLKKEVFLLLLNFNYNLIHIF